MKTKPSAAGVEQVKQSAAKQPPKQPNKNKVEEPAVNKRKISAEAGDVKASVSFFATFETLNL